MPAPDSYTLRGVLKILLFSTLFAGVLLLADCAVNSGLRRISTSDFGVSNLVFSGKANAEILISGSSRARSGYDARKIQDATHLKTFNIGRIGSQTDMQLAFLKAYLKHNAKPKLVIHNLDLFSFLTSHEIYDPAQYLPYLNEEAIFSGILRVYPDAWKWKYLPLYGYVVPDMRMTWILGLNGLVGRQPKEDHFQGYLPRYIEWTDDFEKFQKSHPTGVTTAIEDQGISDLAELIEVCRTRGIALVLVYAPEYYEMQAMERNRKAIFEKFREISERRGIPIWDYSNSAICRNRNYFYNSQHLNADGATAFSRDLALRLAESELLH